MNQVIIITESQRQELLLTQVKEDWLFHPIKDADDNWVVSSQEQDACSLDWLKALPRIDFKRPPQTEPSGSL